jgi:hypothetical protein
MTNIQLIGDIHGNKIAYEEAIGDSEFTIQVGDWGCGFGMTPSSKQGRHLFIHGNHDSPKLCKITEGYIPNGTFWPDESIMFIGGAWSIDYRNRVPELDWWSDEEVSTLDFAKIYDSYKELKPRFVVTHDAPFVATGNLIDHTKTDSERWLKINRTNSWLNLMFEAHQPEKWIFGHWHTSWEDTVFGTEFRCLNINETYDLEV